MRMKLVITLFVAIAAIAAFALPSPSHAETHVIKMMSKDPEDPKKRNVFLPSVLRVKPGDKVVFKAVDKGHNTFSIKGMIPDGAKPWKSKVNSDFEVVLEKPGIYGFRCIPHYALGMVGLIIVEGDNWKANLESAKKIKHFGKSKKVFKALLEGL